MAVMKPERLYLAARGKHPRVSVYCRCGAQWHGHYALNNPVLDYHEKRCGAAVSEAEYVLRTKRAPRKPWKETEP